MATTIEGQAGRVKRRRARAGDGEKVAKFAERLSAFLGIGVQPEDVHLTLGASRSHDVMRWECFFHGRVGSVGGWDSISKLMSCNGWFLSSPVNSTSGGFELSGSKGRLTAEGQRETEQAIGMLLKCAIERRA